MITLSQRREVGEFRKRYRWMALFVLLVFFGLLVRIAQVQLFQRDRWTGIAQENITDTVELPATRGVIRDLQGRIIASNRPSYDVFAIPQGLIDSPETVDRVAMLMGLGSEETAALQQRLSEVPQSRRSHRLELFSDITRAQLAALETHLAELPTLDIVTVPLRSYPYGALGAHAVGYLNEVNAEDLAADDSAYRPGDRIGRSGLEGRYESLLRGTRGYRRVMVDARGRAQHGSQPESLDVDMMRKPVPGHDIQLTIDMDLMEALDRAFRQHPSGAAVVVDVHTGAIRAMYSKPAYDPNQMSSGLSTDQYAALVDNPFRPLIDKTVYETFFPGSTFKTVTALAALEDGIIDPAHRVECMGIMRIGRQRFRCHTRHDWVDLYEALVGSCNVFFWDIADDVGIERITEYAKALGFGERTGIHLGSEAAGFLATRPWYEEHYGKFRVGYTLNTAIGQGNTRVTVLQLAMAYAALANGGTLHVPQLIQNIRGPDGSLFETFRPEVKRELELLPESLELLRGALADVVADEAGTAYAARNRGGVAVAGKTGTAQVVDRKTATTADGPSAWYLDRSHGWFSGFAPAHDPQLAFAILVEHGGSGSTSAAPIAAAIMQHYLGEPKVAENK